MLHNVLRSGPVRIAVAFAFAVSVTTLIVFALVTWRVASADIAQVRGVLEDEAAKAVDTPVGDIKGQFDLRLTHDLRRLDYVGLYDAADRLVYGNMTDPVPIPIDGVAHITTAHMTRLGNARPAVFVARRRADGGILLLGRSLLEVYRLQATMRDAFLAAILPIILIALCAGIAVSLRASARLASIQQAIQHVMEGDLHVRLPVRRKADDIDELVHAVNRMLDEIVRLLNQIKRVGDNIAHDLRTPLTIMRARLERGLQGPSDAMLRALAQEALDDLDRALTTVTALLRISELESGLRRSAFGDVDLVAICHDMFDLFEPLAEARGITMTLHAPSPHVVHGDGELLREALANLIDNAVKFTPPGGTIDVECGCDGALLRVSDSGPGIADEDREKIFLRFYRSPRVREVPGSGLGLSMTATIVELHGYALRIGDNRKGATFEIV